MVLLLRSCYAFLVFSLVGSANGQATDSEIIAASIRVYEIASRAPNGQVLLGSPGPIEIVRNNPESSGNRTVTVKWEIGVAITLNADSLAFKSFTNTFNASATEDVYAGPIVEEQVIRENATYYLRQFDLGSSCQIERIHRPTRQSQRDCYQVDVIYMFGGVKLIGADAMMRFDGLSGQLLGFSLFGRMKVPGDLPPVIPVDRGAALCIQAFIDRYATAYLQVRPPELVWWVPKRLDNPLNYSAQDESDRLEGRPIPVYTMMAVSHPYVSILAEPYVDARTGRIIGWDGRPGSFGGGSKAKPLTWDWGSGPIDVLTKKGWRRVDHADVVSVKAARLAKFDQSVTLRRGHLMVSASFDGSRGLLRLPNESVGRPSSELLRLLRRVR